MGLKEDLINIVGPQWVSDDPAIAYCYTRTFISDVLQEMWPSRSPILVVCPGTVEEIAEIIRTANKYGAHVQVTGATQGLSTPLWTLRTSGGIMLDTKRITIMEVDEANRTETIYCGVYSASRSGEWRRRLEKGIGGPWRPFFAGGPAQSNAVASHLFGGQKFGLWKHGLAWFTLSGAQNIFPDGTVLDTGAGAVVGIPDFWSHGPGPTLHFLINAIGGNMCAAYGIITKIIFKLYPIPDVIDGLFAFYDNYEDAVKAVIELGHMEIGRGVFIGCDWTVSAYSSDSRESSQRLSRASPLAQVGASFWGTKRRVECEKKAFKEIVKKTGGRLMPRELMCVYRGYSFNILGWSQSNSPKEYRHMGTFLYNTAYGVLDPDMIDKYTLWAETFVREMPGYMDHPVYGKNIGLYSSGLQIYPYPLGSSGCDIEYIWAYDLRKKLHAGPIAAFIFGAHKVDLDCGVYQERVAEDYAWGSHGVLYEVMKKIKLEFDPNYITGAGLMFDKGLK